MSAILQAFSSAGMIFRYGWPFIILMLIVAAKVKWKNWIIDVVILERRGKNIIKSNDRACKFTDKYTQLVGYKLLKSRDSIPVVEYDWILHNNLQHTNFIERIVNLIRPTVGTLFLFRYGSKQYKPVIVDTEGESKKTLIATKDKEGKDVYVYQYQQFDPRGYLNPLKMEVFDWDNMNFAIQEMRASLERRQKENNWVKTMLIPISLIAASAMISLIMMKFSLDYSQGLRAAAQSNPQPPQDPTPSIPIIGDVFNPAE